MTRMLGWRSLASSFAPLLRHNYAWVDPIIANMLQFTQSMRPRSYRPSYLQRTDPERSITKLNFPRTRRFFLAAALSLLAASAVAGCDIGNPASATPTTIRANSPAPIPSAVSTPPGQVPQGVSTNVPAPNATTGPGTDALPDSTTTAP